MLWDVLPTGRQPGGAPFNAAVHLHRLGQSVQLISRVGDDELGRELLAYCEAEGLDTHLIQQSKTHLTGVVKATAGPGPAPGMLYRILEPVAWDFLHYTPAVQAAVSQAGMLVYGSLAARRATTRETLYRLLMQAPFKVFDVNLRPPHYRREVVKYLLRQADLVKLNTAELAEITGWLGQAATEATALPWLAGHFGLRSLCVTHADGGATLWTDHQLFQCPGPPGPAPASIGSSDAFLAALLAGLRQGSAPAHYLQAACAAAAAVARQGLADRTFAPLSP